MKINSNFLNLEDSYLFSLIAKKVNEYKQNNPDKEIIRLGIGDVTLPLVPAVTDAIKRQLQKWKRLIPSRVMARSRDMAF
mgnify:CR=1 FL=1